MAMCSGTRLALLVYGIIMHSSVYCSPDTTGLPFPGIRSEDEAYDEDGNQLQNFYDLEPPRIERPASVHRETHALNHPGEIRDVAHAILHKAYRKVLDQLSRKKLLQKLVAKGVGTIQRNRMDGMVISHGQSGIRSDNAKDDSDPLSKRHSDGIFTDSYSRYRKQMAVKKYLAAVLGKRPEDVNTDHLLLYINNDALLQGDFEVMVWENCCRHSLPVSLWGRLLQSQPNSTRHYPLCWVTILILLLSLILLLCVFVSLWTLSPQGNSPDKTTALSKLCFSPEFTPFPGAGVGRLYREGRLEYELPFLYFQETHYPKVRTIGTK